MPTARAGGSTGGRAVTEETGPDPVSGVPATTPASGVAEKAPSDGGEGVLSDGSPRSSGTVAGRRGS